MKTRAPSADDADEVAQLLDASEAIPGVEEPPTYSADLIRDFWHYVDDLSGDAWLALDDAESAVGVAWVSRRRSGIADISVRAHPRVAGKGISAALLDRAEARAGEAVAQANALTRNTRAERLLTSRGYEPVRSYFWMGIDLPEEPTAPKWPNGIGVATVTPERERDLHAAAMEAFAEEWGFVQRPFDEWRQLRIERDKFEPALWFVALDGDEVCGFALCSEWHDGCVVESLGVLPGYRRRGLGRALLQHAFREFARRSARRGMLGVDTANPTGATRLYERVGMRVLWQSTTYEKRLR